jgi:predicted outer membrane repeat protein
MTSIHANSRRPLVVAIALALGAGSAQATLTLTVTTGGDAGTPSDCTLRQAIESANNDNAGSSSCAAGSGTDTIVFADNLVNTTVTLSQGQLVITSPLTISGNGQTIDAHGASRVLYVNTATFTANSVTLTGGAAPPGASGGGVLSNAGTINLTNTTISGNIAQKGGGVSASITSITLTNCTISGNTAVLSGGGLAASNTATVTFGNTTLTNNTAGMHGGGVYGTLVTINGANSTISGNTAGEGGGLWTFTSNASFTDSTISGNTSANYAGIYWKWQTPASGTVTLTNTTVSGNTATDVGGGVFVAGGTATFTNTTISGNSAGASGGVGSATGTVTFSNTILGNNTGGDCSASNSTINGGHTLVADPASAAACGIAAGGANGNIVGQDPMLAPLADNGGPTQTRALDAVSPALNAGSVALAISGNDTLNYDQRGFGFPRTLNGGVDIGAYQHQGDRVFADGSEPEP